MSDALPPVITTQQKSLYAFDTLCEWFIWGPRSILKGDIRTGDTAVPDASWVDWSEAIDNEVFPNTIYKYAQHRFYAWIPSDVRASRNKAETPQFIFHSFVLRWKGDRYIYQYTTHSEYYTHGLDHLWAYTYAGSGHYEFANYHYTETTAIEDNILPIYLVP